MKKGQIIFGLCYIVVQMLILPLILSILNVLLHSPLTIAELNFVCFAVNFIVLTVVYRNFLFASAQVIPKTFGRYIGITVSGFALYWLSSYLINILVYLLDPAFSNVNDDSILEMVNESPELMWVGTVLLVPIAEELLFRGAIFGGLYRRNKVIAYTVSIIAFGLLHVLGYVGFYPPYRLLLCFLQYIPAGLFLSWAYAKSGTIFSPILIHMVINFIGISVM